MSTNQGKPNFKENQSIKQVILEKREIMTQEIKEHVFVIIDQINLNLKEKQHMMLSLSLKKPKIQRIIIVINMKEDKFLLMVKQLMKITMFLMK